MSEYANPNIGRPLPATPSLATAMLLCIALVTPGVSSVCIPTYQDNDYGSITVNVAVVGDCVGLLVALDWSNQTQSQYFEYIELSVPATYVFNNVWNVCLYQNNYSIPLSCHRTVALNCNYQYGAYYVQCAATNSMSFVLLLEISLLIGAIFVVYKMVYFLVFSVVCAKYKVVKMSYYKEAQRFLKRPVIGLDRYARINVQPEGKKDKKKKDKQSDVETDEPKRPLPSIPTSRMYAVDERYGEEIPYDLLYNEDGKPMYHSDGSLIHYDSGDDDSDVAYMAASMHALSDADEDAD